MNAKKLNQSVWCKIAPSKIHGIGVFAIRDIPKGTKLTDHTIWAIQKNKYYEMDAKEFMQIIPEIRSLILDRMIFPNEDKLVFVSPNHDQILRSFMNHSKTANSDGEVALFDILKGEEITEDFTTLEDTPHEFTINHLKQYGIRI